MLAEPETLTHLYLHHTEVTDRGAAAILQLPNLRELVINYTSITCDTLKGLNEDSQPSYFDANDTQLTDEGLELIAE